MDDNAPQNSDVKKMAFNVLPPMGDTRFSIFSALNNHLTVEITIGMI